MSRRVAIAGVTLSDVGRVEDRAPFELMARSRRQLRGERQIVDAKLMCVSGTGGWFCSSGTLILGT